MFAGPGLRSRLVVLNRGTQNDEAKVLEDWLAEAGAKIGAARPKPYQRLVLCRGGVDRGGLRAAPAPAELARCSCDIPHAVSAIAFVLRRVEWGAAGDARVSGNAGTWRVAGKHAGR
jgi:hypothetical protein